MFAPLSTVRFELQIRNAVNKNAATAAKQQEYELHLISAGARFEDGNLTPLFACRVSVVCLNNSRDDGGGGRRGRWKSC